MPRLSSLIGTLFGLGFTLTAVPATAGNSQFSAETGALCRAPIAAAEQDHRIPRQLLAGVSLAESGRWHAAKKESFAWPWTVTSGKKSRYFESRGAAIREVKHLRAHGVRNIDVGCMQVNLHYHPAAFASLEEAFDPAANVAYAADFLVALHAETRSWTRSVARYHSSTPALGSAYFVRVSKLWQRERHRVAAQRRREVRAAYEARKAARDAKRRDQLETVQRARPRREVSLVPAPASSPESAPESAPESS